MLAVKISVEGAPSILQDSLACPGDCKGKPFTTPSLPRSGGCPACRSGCEGGTSGSRPRLPGLNTCD